MADACLPPGPEPYLQAQHAQHEVRGHAVAVPLQGLAAEEGVDDGVGQDAQVLLSLPHLLNVLCAQGGQGQGGRMSGGACQRMGGPGWGGTLGDRMLRDVAYGVLFFLDVSLLG